MTEVVLEGWWEVLTALDGQRPVIVGEAVREWPPEQLAELIAAGLLTEIAPTRSLACPGCPEAPFCDVICTERHTGERRALLACPNCGLQAVPLDDLRRWQVERGAVLELVRQTLRLAGQRSKIVSGRLWRLGRLHHGGTPWSVWFAFQLFRRDAGDLVVRGQLPARALLLVPGRQPEFLLPHGVVSGSLRDLTEWSDNGLQWNAERLEELLHVPASESHSPKKPASTRRQSRATDIEALVAELKQHLRSARDHAVHTRDSRGVPALLPRRTQKDLARRLGITESRVSRSLNDERAAALRLLWSLADDLDQMLRFVP